MPAVEPAMAHVVNRAEAHPFRNWSKVKHYRKWHSRVFLNICFVVSIFGLGFGFIMVEAGHNDIGWILIGLGAIESFGIPYFWQMRNDRDGEWQ